MSSYEGVTPIKDLITENNLEEARVQSPNPILRKMAADDFNDGIAEDSHMPRRFSMLKK